MFNKIFCIGFNKTGTSSMHRLFGELGLQAWHGFYSHLPVSDPLFSRFRCFSDGDQHDFAALDSAFPGSKFIVTTRPLEDWLISRIRHVEYRRSIGSTGPMREEYEADPERAVAQWIERRLRYHRQVQQYFLDREHDLLLVDICARPAAAASLARIMSFLGIETPPGLLLPHENSHAGRHTPDSIPVRDNGKIRQEILRALQATGLGAECLRSVFP
ncbi:MAG: hypothetical protein QY320_10575 [Gammaproteobacteria bacterium]|nr:MAG: hypothetical protein QY320_10575 [Gammaproteobacteria bacterium]